MHKICFTISLFHTSTYFEHHVLIVRRSEIVLYSLCIITPIGVHLSIFMLVINQLDAQNLFYNKFI